MTTSPFDHDEPPEPAPAEHEAQPGDTPPPDVAVMSFEDALAELERIVKELEQGELDLDAAIGAYERGTALRRHCEAKLKEARLRVERITLGPDDDPRAEPMDAG